MEVHSPIQKGVGLGVAPTNLPLAIVSPHDPSKHKY